STCKPSTLGGVKSSGTTTRLCPLRRFALRIGSSLLMSLLVARSEQVARPARVPRETNSARHGRQGALDARGSGCGRALPGQELSFQSVPDEFSQFVESKLAHQIGAMCLDGARAD